MSNEENDLPESIVEQEDLNMLFKGAVPVQITITEPADLLVIIHSILRMMCHGDVSKADSFLHACSSTAKVIGVEAAVAQGIQALTSVGGDNPPACLKPLLIHSLSHSLNPDNRKAFDEYLAAKKKKGGKK